MNETMKYIYSYITLLFTTLSMCQNISLVPDNGYQGANDLNIVLVAPTIDFYDPYANYDIYFSNSSLNITDEDPLAVSVLQFNLDVDPNISPGEYDLYIEYESLGSPAVVDSTVFLILDNPSEITFVYPDEIVAGASAIIDIYGSETSWNNQSDLRIVNDWYDDMSELINVNWINVLSPSYLQASLTIDQWMYTGSFDIIVDTPNMSTSLINGLFILPPDQLSIEYINPNTGIQGENNLFLDIGLANIDFYDSYSDHTIYFSDSDIEIINSSIINTNSIGAYINLKPWALGSYDITVGSVGPSGGQWQYDTYLNAFEVLENSNTELLAVYPNYSYQNSNNLTVNLTASGVDFYDSYANYNMYFSGNGIYVNDLNPISPTELEANLYISQWANTGYRDVFINLNDEITIGLEDGFEIKDPEIISITPDFGIKGAEDLEVTLLAGGIDFYDPYTYYNMYFSGTGVYVNDINPISSTELQASIDIYQDINTGYRDVNLYYATDFSSPNILVKENGFEIRSEGVLGDLNGDGILNILDILSMVNIIINYEYNQFADINEDGVVNILDILIAVNLVLNQ